MQRLACLLTALFLTATMASAYELSPDLQARVDRLIAEVESTPSNVDNVAARAATLFEWANAASLEGAFIPKNLSLVVNSTLNPTPGTEPSGFMVGSIDLYVRQLAILAADPAAFGEVAVTPAARVPVDSHQTITAQWTIGSKGIAVGGGFIVSRALMGGYSPLQIADPTAEGWVSASSSRQGVRFGHDQAPVFGPYGGFRGAANFPTYRVEGTALEPGDVITLTYGDTSQGSPGMMTGNFTNTAIGLPLHIDTGNGEFYEMPLPSFEVIGGPAAGVHGFAPSIVRPGEPFEIHVRTEDRAYNRAEGAIPDYEVYLNGALVDRLEAGKPIQRLETAFAAPGVYRYSFRSTDGSIAGVANPILVRDGDRRIYWGETHGHCGFAEGQGTPEGYFEFARDDARLDFVTLSEHDIWLTDAKWRTLTLLSEQYNEPNRFAVYPGYEWSSRRETGGHHNVFFRRPGPQRVPVQRAPLLTDLYRELRVDLPTEDVLIIPHAHQAGDWRLSDLDMESLVEIMSGHGTFEWFGQRYLENGWRVGFAAASDDHIGHPGYSPGHPSGPGNRSNIFQFGGLAGTWSEDPSSDAIFDALKARSAYATTGSRRIILDATLDGHEMGTEVPMNEQPEIAVRAIGTTAIRRLDVIRNGEVVATLDYGATSQEGHRRVLVDFNSESWVDFRDNPRGQRTWRGRLTVEGATLVGGQLTGTPDPISDVLSIDGSTATFDVATRGASRTLLLELDDVTDLAKVRFDLDAGRESGTAPQQRRTPQRFGARSFALAIPSSGTVVEKLTEGNYTDSVSLSLAAEVDDIDARIRVTARPDDWFYVRVEQIDGHLAWGSPWWVGSEPPR